MAGSARDRWSAFFSQPAVRRSMPAIAGLGAVTLAAVLYMAMSTGPQRVLYGNLADTERAAVVAALETGGIDYKIDNATGSMSVAEDDLYRARMLVASDGALSLPETGAQMLDAIPIGSSRTLEGERLRNIRERELMLTIGEIDGVEAVRVHLAQPERSVFVREDIAPGASVMVRMARGRSLSDDQVTAIVNLVAGSVPGMQPGAVRVVDQHGRLLSASIGSGDSRLEVQRQFEEKLRAQIAQLLIPMLGDGNFTSEVQVELDMAEVTSARESYDKEGALRSESETQSQQAGAGAAAGVPGVLSNTPPPPTGLEAGAPQGTQPAANDQTSGESSARRNYELGREVAVSSTGPGGVKRVSVAVALSKDALAKIAPANGKQIEALVSSAVGAQPARGDEVTVIVGSFDAAAMEEPPFYETPWFATILRNAVALIAVVLALIFGVRPLIGALRHKDDKIANASPHKNAADAAAPAGTIEADAGALVSPSSGAMLPIPATDSENAIVLREQVALAQQLAAQQPDRAVAALRRMLAAPQPSAGDTA
ncbi:flagellar basal-body MS-ring/collar protein FliF [Croceicoccus sp. F390]|uniref:Flagellar M-ring protein n=1 Tax=Croceicoccus esteveae TaxID=3075597 RepID=A0ABU2ZDL4_9SPHN|nr:flagellar basal-body MS-ring/collar protein FliF [Croceicoccus sp. F390]MDT0574691.1 flagellar basal-body MS-ring/collar protein FliF [Croceicoccus sp. F390]